MMRTLSLVVAGAAGTLTFGASAAWAEPGTQNAAQPMVRLPANTIQLPAPPSFGGTGLRLSPGQANLGTVSPGRGTFNVSPGQTPGFSSPGQATGGNVSLGQWAGDVVSPGQVGAGTVNPGESVGGSVNPGQGSVGVNLGSQTSLVDPGQASGQPSVSQRLFAAPTGGQILLGGADTASAEAVGRVESTPDLERRLDAVRALPSDVRQEALFDVLRRTMNQQAGNPQSAEQSRTPIASGSEETRTERKDGCIWIRGTALKSNGAN